MEARETGSDALKISFLEGKPEEIAEHIRELAASVRGLFIVRGWNDDSVGPKGGKPTAKTAPFSWRLMGAGGQPEPVPSKPTIPPQVIEKADPAIMAERIRNIQEIERLKMQLELKEQRERWQEELADDDDDDDDDERPDDMERMERIAGIVGKIVDRVFPQVITKPPAQPITGTTAEPSDDAALLAAMKRYREANPEQAAAVEKQLMDNYGTDDTGAK
jgi:hypothetical protein